MSLDQNLKGLLSIYERFVQSATPNPRLQGFKNVTSSSMQRLLETNLEEANQIIFERLFKEFTQKDLSEIPIRVFSYCGECNTQTSAFQKLYFIYDRENRVVYCMEHKNSGNHSIVKDRDFYRFDSFTVDELRVKLIEEITYLTAQNERTF